MVLGAFLCVLTRNAGFMGFFLCFLIVKLFFYQIYYAFFLKKCLFSAENKHFSFGNVSITILLRNYLPNHLFSSFEDRSYPNPSIKLE